DGVDSCFYANDGECDEFLEDPSESPCELGTDWSDCGLQVCTTGNDVSSNDGTLRVNVIDTFFTVEACETAPAPTLNDSCETANNGICEESARNPGFSEESGDECEPGTDDSDCNNSCAEYAFSDTCDEGSYCPVGTDTFDCDNTQVSAETCTWATAMFSLTKDGKSITDLTEEQVSMLIDGRDPGAEGLKALEKDSGLIVRLLLDSSYSISEAGAADGVRDAAVSFLQSLPEESRVAVGQFASEGQVPTFICADGTEGTQSVEYSSSSASVQTVENYYRPYTSPTSKSQTSIFDAAVRWSSFRTSDSALLLPRVMVVFTDGKDTASNILTAQQARSEITANDGGLSVYAVGLGSDVDVEDLNTLSEGRSFLASDEEELKEAFEQVADELSALYRLRILVSRTSPNAEANLTINYNGSTTSRDIIMGDYGAVASTPPPGVGSCQ
ncbi:MAG: VWA domain-containing protein, partial [Polyangiaceae bacterium]|nr:VWA domain-containing protein [Polyangiaceae bacterium]